MTSHDLSLFLIWYCTLFFLGVLFFPLTAKVFYHFKDKGYAFSKIIGLLLTSYVVFILGISRIIQFNSLTIILVALFISGSSIIILFPRPFREARKKIVSFFTSSWKLLLIEEILFLVSLYFLSYIRAFAPDIHGLEKYMDFGFINSIYRSDFFPPKDMWFTPFSINYYYFGHLVTAVLTKLSGLQTHITYNLMLACIFAMSITASFSLVFTFITSVSSKHIKHAYVFAIMSALVLSLAGNLHSVYTFFEPYQNENPVPLWELSFQPSTFPNQYWYPNATRFIYNTIHEFPMYSWTVSDLHGHVLDIPFVLLTIATLFSYYLFMTKRIADTHPRHVLHKENTTTLSSRGKTRFLLFIGLLLSVMYMTNAWDGIIYLLLVFFLIVFLEWRHTSNTHTGFRLPIISNWIKHKNNFLSAIGSIALQSMLPFSIVLVGLIFFSLPFSLSFKPFVSGIGVLCAPEFLTTIGRIGPFLFEPDHCQHSPWWQLIILHGFFYFFVISFFVFLWKTKKIHSTDVFILLLITLSTLLIIIPEFIYAKDIYPGHYRANTMFKLVFQSFMMLSLCVGYIFFRIVSSGAKRFSLPRFVFVVLAFVLITIVFIYPFLAINSYYGDLTNYTGLDGTTYLKTLYPDDYEAILWIQKNIVGQPVILEAQGDAYGGASSYTDYARVSANTGLPTVLGWTVHEWLWRGTYDIPAPRIEEVRLMYESENINETENLLNKYDIEYVFLGALEKEKYPLLNTEKFHMLGNTIYQSGETKIIKLEKND